MREVEYTNEFHDWWNTLTAREQEDVAQIVALLQQLGPNLHYPHSSGIKNSKYSHLRELRIQHKGKPYRVLYAFDPRRIAILLIGGNKTGYDHWYEKYIAIADKLYQEHVVTLKKEESIRDQTV